jgi:hypothetical protein
MPQIRVGDRVAPIMAMHMTGHVVSMEVRPHKTMMVDGPLSHTTYASVQPDNPKASIITYRVGDLVRLDA